MNKLRRSSLFASDGSGQGPNDGCDHGDYGEESDADYRTLILDQTMAMANDYA